MLDHATDTRTYVRVRPSAHAQHIRNFRVDGAVLGDLCTLENGSSASAAAS